MTEMVEIKDGELILARHIPAELAWQNGLNFFSNSDDYQQVGTWGYGQGKQLLAHTHNGVRREVLWTQEVLFIRNGKIEAEIFDTADEKVANLEIRAGDILILLRGGHGYRILEEGTQVLEIKNGPYVGADADRRRL
jgi:hypothetical protein